MNAEDVLGALWGTGVHSICSQPPGGVFGPRGFHSTPIELVAHARDLTSGGHDVWFGVNPLPAPPDSGRGRSSDVVEVWSLYADLDWRDDVHASTELPTELETRSVLETFVLPPSIVIASGHGLHVYWLLDRSVPAKVAVELQRRLHDELRRRGLAPERFDLASVLRVPGTRNHKLDARVVTVEVADLDARYHPVDVWSRLEPPPEQAFDPLEDSLRTQTTTGIPRTSAPPPSGGIEETPAEWYNAHHPIRDLLIARGWTYAHTDRDGEHWVRPGKTKQQGTSARVYDDVVVVFTTHFPQLVREENRTPSGTGWRYDPFEFYAALDHDGDKRAAASEVRRTMMPAPPRARQDPLSGPQSDETGLGGTTDAGGMRRISIASANTMPPETVEWLWPGRIPLGKVTVLDGDPGVSKSVLTLDVAARASQGRPWPDESHVIRRPRNSLIITAEDGLRDTVVPRLIAAEANLDRVFLLEQIDSGLYDATGTEIPDILKLPSDTSMLAHAIVDYGVDLVVLDVFAAFMEQGYDMNSDQDVRAILTPLSKIAERTGAAIVALRHLNKRPGVSAIYRGGGSIGITGAARVGLLAAHHPDDVEQSDVNQRRRVLAVSKSNIAAYAPSLAYRTVAHDNVVRIVWEGSVHYSADDLVTTTPGQHERQGERDQIDGFLTEALLDGPILAKEIRSMARQNLVTDYQLAQAAKRLGVKKAPSSFEGQWYWKLPPDHGE